MAGDIYFQWQNEFMLKTIYPLREMKLRDFLIYYFEIDQWALYKNKTINDLQGEVKTYLENQERLRGEAFDTYQSLSGYFTRVNVAADYQPKYPVLDPELSTALTAMRGLFMRYFPTYKNPVKENYFITTQISNLEIMYKDVQREIGAIQRRIRCRSAAWPDRPKNEQRQALLENGSLKVVEEELGKLRTFLSASTKIEKRRLELYKWQTQKQKEKTEVSVKLNQRLVDVNKLDAQHKELAQSEARMKSPNIFEELKAYFLKPDVTAEVRSAIPDFDAGFMTRVTTLHQQFKVFPENPASQKYFVDNLLNIYTANWKAFTGAAQKMASAELRRMRDFSEAIDLRTKPPEQAKQVIQQRESQRMTMETQLNQAKVELQAIQNQLNAVDNDLNTPEKQLFSQNFQAAEVSVQDIVRARVEDYRSQLSTKQHTELLELVVRKFLDEPKRFPIWLQYMVIHFSGMRYQSAHGSWADPRDLLNSLTEKEVEREILPVDELMIEELCRAKIAIYQQALPAVSAGTAPSSAAAPSQPAAETGKPPALALTADPKWKEKVQNYLGKLKAYRSRYKITPANGLPTATLYKDSAGTLAPAGQPPLPKGEEVLVDTIPLTRDQDYYLIQEYSKPGYTGFYLAGQDLTLVPNPRKRKVLLDLRIDEETYKIEKADDKQVLDELRALKEQLGFPAWMWNEIVKLTGLRLQEVQTANWEQTSDEDQAERLSYKWREYNNLMSSWKEANLTGWREEHDLSSKLVVTRAVCNEVAEHCQHLRGNSPPGGLTAKPSWYQRQERNPKIQAGPDKAYLTRINSAADMKPGGSILWLEFVYEEPNAWRIAHPLKLSSGEGLLTPPLNVPRGDDGGNQFDPKKGYVIKSASSWNYYQDSQGRYKRSRSVVTTDDKSYRQVQWLRWIHEATIVDVAETADGPVVLTFETALPYEDKRRSTIGVFKHPLNWLVYNVTGTTFNGSFVGYTPEGDVPYTEMQEMLNWNHILLNDNFMTPAQMQDYYNKAGYKLTRDLAPAVRQSQVEAAPVLKRQAENHIETISCFEVDPIAKTAKPYTPEIEVMRINVPRGTRMVVSDSVLVGVEKYYRVVSCEAEPGLQDLYVRASEVLLALESAANKPVSASQPLNLWKVKYADAQGLPTLEAIQGTATPAPQLSAGTRLLVSAVHKVAASDSGDGFTRDASGKRYALVVECPDLSRAAGSFILADNLLPLTMDEYIHGATGKGAEIMQKMRLRVTPLDGTNQAALYKITAQLAAERGLDSLPRDAVLTVTATPQFATNMDEAFYRIEVCESRPAFVGLNVNVEDVTLAIDQAV